MFRANLRGRAAACAACLALLTTAGCFDILEDGETTGTASLVFVLPESGTTVSEAITIGAMGDGITSVSVTIDGAVISEDNDAPFEWILDPSSFTIGAHEVVLTATQDGTRRSVTVNVTLEGGSEPPPSEDPPSDPPSEGNAEFVVPADGATIQAPVVLTVTGEGVTSVRFLLDSTEVANDTSAPFQWTIDPTQVSDGAHTLRIEANYNGGTDVHQSAINTLQPGSDPAPPSEVLTAIQNLQPGQWYEIKGTRMDAVKPDPVPEGNFANIMEAWSSGAYDTKRDRLIIWGGGHADYSGNEIYAFSMKTFSWTRVSEPSAFPPGDGWNVGDARTHPDGAPVSRHTYDYIDYLPTVDRFVSAGGAGLWRTGQFGDSATRTFDFETKRWAQKSVCPTSTIGSASAVGPDGRLWTHGAYGDAATLCAWDPTSDTWTRYREYRGWLGYGRTGEIDPVENKFLMIGIDGVMVWDLNNPNQVVATPSTTGAKGLESQGDPGVAYHPGTKRIVGWRGGTTVYALDVKTMNWTSRSGTVINGDAPSTNGGTFGRWRYVPSLDVFVLVNSVKRNVYVYKHG